MEIVDHEESIRTFSYTNITLDQRSLITNSHTNITLATGEEVKAYCKKYDIKLSEFRESFDDELDMSNHDLPM